jgi:hypothetical protein
VRSAVNHRRVWFFTIALLLALAFGAALFKAVMAGPPPTAGGPARPVPTTSAPSTPAPSEPWSLPDPSPEPMRDGGAAADVEKTEAPHTRKPRPAPTTPKATPTTVAVHYKNCGQARKAGAAPIQREDPGYSTTLDNDGNGVACENGKD